MKVKDEYKFNILSITSDNTHNNRFVLIILKKHSIAERTIKFP